MKEFAVEGDCAVLCAKDIEPSIMAGLSEKQVKAILLENGSKTSHTVIIAKAKGFVTLVGVSLEGTEAADGDKVIVYYMKEVTDKVQRINIKSTSFPKNFIVYGDTIMKTEDDEVLPYKLTAYKVAPQSNMSLSFSNNGDPGSITITCDLMADGDDNILDLVLIEE